MKGFILTVIVLGFIVIAVASGKNDHPVASAVVHQSSGSTQFACGSSPVPIPPVMTHSSLKQCQKAARAMMDAMLTNLRVTVACREELVDVLPVNLPSARDVRESNARIMNLMSSIEQGADQQISKANTLAKCQAYLHNAQRLIEVQPEFRGEWQ